MKTDCPNCRSRNVDWWGSKAHHIPKMKCANCSKVFKYSPSENWCNIQHN